jgi:RNA polymerase sigma-70 factor (ECF subfamily)
LSHTPLEGILPAAPENVAADAAEQDRLIARCLQGEAGAHLAVYNQYAAPIYRLCFSLLQHREDAEEVLQDTFEYAFRKLANYDAGRASFKTWLYQIAVSRCRNKRRRKWLETLPLNNLFGKQMEDEETPTPSEALALTEIQQSVWDAIGRLSPKLRETAVLRYYEGYTYVEIGRILSISPKTAESRMRLAHKALRELLRDEFE